jgi:hypothetical protein
VLLPAAGRLPTRLASRAPLLLTRLAACVWARSRWTSGRAKGRVR